MREKFWEKLNENQRSFKWFYDNYLKESKQHYNTLYKQAKGVFITTISPDLELAINKYLNQ